MAQSSPYLKCRDQEGRNFWGVEFHKTENQWVNQHIGPSSDDVINAILKEIRREGWFFSQLVKLLYFCRVIRVTTIFPFNPSYNEEGCEFHFTAFCSPFSHPFHYLWRFVERSWYESLWRWMIKLGPSGSHPTWPMLVVMDGPIGQCQSFTLNFFGLKIHLDFSHLLTERAGTSFSSTLASPSSSVFFHLAVCTHTWK